MSSRPTAPNLETLIGLFYADGETDKLGRFRETSGEQMPPWFRSLLDHNEHMTVTVESHHRCPVDVEVLQTQVTDTHYSRKILLRRQRDRGVVQFGIVRLCFEYLDPEVRAEIEAQQTPLGRVLIEHNVLREVQLTRLWEVLPGIDLQRTMGVSAEHPIYGRTAMIYCNGEPAVELLEIVTPS